MLGEAKKKGNAVAISDDVVFGWAVHYFDEDNIKINNVQGVRASVSSSKVPAAKTKIELTEEEKEEARKAALKEFQDQEMQKIKEKNKKRLEKKNAENPQPSLFDI